MSFVSSSETCVNAGLYRFRAYLPITPRKTWLELMTVDGWLPIEGCTVEESSHSVGTRVFIADLDLPDGLVRLGGDVIGVTASLEELKPGADSRPD